MLVPKHYTKLERLARDKHSSLLRKPYITAVISFMIQASGANVIKQYRSSLQPFHGNYQDYIAFIAQNDGITTEWQ